jgi:hypothetical protein
MNEELITELKDKYSSIYSVRIGKKEYVFRPLTFTEYGRLLRHDEWNQLEFEDALVEMVLLYPAVNSVEYNTMPAGVPTELAEEVLRISGITSPKFAIQVLNEKRSNADSVMSSIKAFIIAAMPAYKDDDLNEFTFEELIEKVVLSEKILNIKMRTMVHGEQVELQISDPEEEAKKSKGLDPNAADAVIRAKLQQSMMQQGLAEGQE